MINILIYLISLIGIGLLAGSFTIFFKKGNPVTQVNTLLTTILGGAIFPVTTLNGFLEFLSDFVPGKYIINIFRNILDNNGALVNEIYTDTLSLLLLSCILFVMGILIFKYTIYVTLKRDQLFNY